VHPNNPKHIALTHPRRPQRKVQQSPAPHRLPPHRIDKERTVVSQPLIVLGDKTSHGGTVIGGAPTTDTHGKRIARMGDMVSCPRCSGIHHIAQGDPTLVVEGAPAAYNGCKTSCGAVLIAGQMFTTDEPGAGGGVASASGTSNVVAVPPTGSTAALVQQAGLPIGAIGSGLLAAYEEEPLDDEPKRYRGRFQVLDERSGEPVSVSSRVRSTAGQYLLGETDGEGFTQWVERDAAEHLAFDLQAEAGR
jgi:uncharacterized Zn-binding protein involved in type VI secretion